jgi:hypothetical protein
MNTLRLCAAIGLGLSMAFASGCNSDSNSGKRDGGRDLGFNRDAPINTRTSTSTRTSTNTSTNTPCTDLNGNTYQLGQSFTNNCVTYTCVSGGTFTSSGSPCPDAATTTPDTRINRDLPIAPDVGPTVDGGSPPADVGGNRDVTPTEVGRRDTNVPLDLGAPDLPPVGKDTAPPAVDTAPPEPDLAVPADVPVPVRCTDGVQFYNPGDTFACDCNTCICNSSGVILPLTSNNCAVDAE